MTIQRRRQWTPPLGQSVEDMVDWIQRHYQDHVLESGTRIQDIRSELDIYEATIDHGSIDGLDDDDHTQYVLADGTRDMTGHITATNIESVSTGEVADDGGYSYTPTFPIGSIIIHVVEAAGVAASALLAYRVTDTHASAHIAGSALVEVATGALTGTDGSDAVVTVSPNSADGKIYVENRLGDSLQFQITHLL